MTKKIWTQDKLDLIKVYLENGLNYKQIAKNLNLTYGQVEHAVRRYNLKEGIEQDLLFAKEKSKLKKEDITKLARVIGEKVYENYKHVKLEEPKALKIKGKREEMSILDISDVHVGMINEVFDSDTGKKVITYNMGIFQKELNNLQHSIAQIHEILSNSYNLRELTIFCLGDLVTNDRIFPEQTLEIEKVVGLQVWDAVNYFAKFFNNMLKYYEKITIVGVVGNHGRSMPNYYEEPVENNFEYFIYKIWEKQFADSKRIKIIVPSTRRYIHTVLNWKHLIEHGDAMRGSSENYIEKQIKELSLNIGGFDVMHFGHFHKLKEREIADKVIVKQNGCWILKDSYAFSKYKTYSIPKQHFFGCNSKRPETFSYKIDLRG